MRENESGHRTVGAGAPGDPDRDETAPAAGDDPTGHGVELARAGQEPGKDGVGSAGGVVEAVAAFVDDLVEDGACHHSGA